MQIKNEQSGRRSHERRRSLERKPPKCDYRDNYVDDRSVRSKFKFSFVSLKLRFSYKNNLTKGLVIFMKNHLLYL